MGTQLETNTESLIEIHVELHFEMHIEIHMEKQQMQRHNLSCAHAHRHANREMHVAAFSQRRCTAIRKSHVTINS